MYNTKRNCKKQPYCSIARILSELTDKFLSRRKKRKLSRSSKGKKVPNAEVGLILYWLYHSNEVYRFGSIKLNKYSGLIHLESLKFEYKVYRNFVLVILHQRSLTHRGRQIILSKSCTT